MSSPDGFLGWPFAPVDRTAGIRQWAVTGAVILLIAGCATDRSGDRAGAHRPSREVADTPAPAWERDGPDPHPPPDLALVPDAEPEPEPIRRGGPNKPYEALGQTYVPIVEDRPYVERGLATWYGRKFHGHRTSSGEPYDMYAMTAAHPVLPIPSYAKVRNPANGREVIVRINDRGPFHSGRIIDLSYTAALKLGVLRGATAVEVQHITADDIRTGAWRSPASTVVAEVPSPDQSVPIATPVPAASADMLPLDPIQAPIAAPLPLQVATPPAPPPPTTAPSTPTWWLQFGAFRERDAAAQLSRNVAMGAQWLAPLLTVAVDARWFRLQAGPYASAADARDAAERLRRDLQVAVMVLSRPESGYPK